MEKKPIGKEIAYESLDETGKAIFWMISLFTVIITFESILNLIKELNFERRRP